jgi:beta-mannanase
MPSALRLCAVVILVVAAVAGVRSRADAATSQARAPAAGVTDAGAQTLFGLDVPGLDELDTAEAAIGSRAAIVGTFADWAHAPDFPRATAEAIDARGAVPMISWEPWDSWRGGAAQPGFALDRITAGAHDALIDRWAAQIAGYGRPVLLRFAPEMNGDWLPWSTGRNGNGAGDYVAAWRHVRGRFRRAGATNALWVWNPIAAEGGAAALRGVFPGAREVDWLAVDGYNWGSTRGWGWQSYADVFAPTVAALRSLAPGLPVMLAEVGCAPDAARPAWVASTLHDARTQGIAALVWFEFDKETDWRLGGDPATAAAAQAALSDPGWRQGGDAAAIGRALRRTG